jgi:hypothetical protein
MIEQADERLQQWAKSTVEGIEVRFDLPDKPSGRFALFYLLELLDLPPLRTAKIAPLQLSARYLVTTWGKTEFEAHEILSKLVFTAMADPDWQVELRPMAAEVWNALGIPPRPSFWITIPLLQPRVEPEAKPVRSRLVINSSFVTPLHGVVLGPGEVPISDALVELPALGAHTRSDRNGRFRFAAVPAAGTATQVLVRAKGKDFSVSTEEDHSMRDHPFVINLKLLED